MFDPKGTRTKQFNGLSGKKDVQMMQQMGQFKARTHRALNADIVELPYKGDVSMFIVVPESRTQTQAEFDAFVEALTNTPMSEVTQGLYNMVITVEMPKITLDETYSLSQSFESIGIEHLIGRSSDFSALSSRSPLSIDEMMHKTRMQIDETGTTASAATYSVAKSFGSEAVVADHPFVFFVYDTDLDQVLFTGVYSNAQ